MLVNGWSRNSHSECGNPNSEDKFIFLSFWMASFNLQIHVTGWRFWKSNLTSGEHLQEDKNRIKDSGDQNSSTCRILAQSLLRWALFDQLFSTNSNVAKILILFFKKNKLEDSIRKFFIIRNILHNDHCYMTFTRLKFLRSQMQTIWHYFQISSLTINILI